MTVEKQNNDILWFKSQLDSNDRRTLFAQVVCDNILERCKIDHMHFNEMIDYCQMDEWADDIEQIRQLLLNAWDIHTSHLICYFFWSYSSWRRDGCWLAFNDKHIELEIISMIPQLKKRYQDDWV